MDASNNPILAQATPLSTYSAPQTTQSHDPRLVKIIAELGLRFRPLSLADQEAHAAQVALLTRDLRGTNPDDLATAADEWSRNERFMPKASELLAIIRRSRPKAGDADLQALADRGNLLCTRPDLHWVVRNGDIKLEPRGRV